MFAKFHYFQHCRIKPQRTNRQRLQRVSIEYYNNIYYCVFLFSAVSSAVIACQTVGEIKIIKTIICDMYYNIGSNFSSLNKAISVDRET